MRRALATAALALGLFGCDSAPAEPKTVELSVEGMVCESCSQAIEHEVGKLEGVASCKVDLEQKTARVSFDPDTVEVATIEATIDKMGYEATPPS